MKMPETRYVTHISYCNFVLVLLPFIRQNATVLQFYRLCFHGLRLQILQFDVIHLSDLLEF